MAIVPRFRITNALTSALARIERAREFVDEARLSEDWIASMQAWARVVEAHHTTRLAGLGFTIELSERILAGVPPDGADENQVRMLRSARDALDLFRELQPTAGTGARGPRPSTLPGGLIADLHRRVTGAPISEVSATGGYRSGNGEVSDPRSGKVVFSPPPPGEVPGLVSELIEWLGVDHRTDEVLAAGIAQHLLLKIRPFEDGNGRAARLLSLYCLHRSGFGLKGLFSLSEPYDRDRAVYLRALRSAGEQGDLTVWLEYFAEMLAVQVRDVQDRAERVVRRDQIAGTHPLSPRQRAALAHAHLHGRITVPEFEKLAPGISRSTLLKDLRGILDRGLLIAETIEGERSYRIPPSATI